MAAYPLAPANLSTKLYHLPLTGGYKQTLGHYLVAQPAPAGVGRRAVPAFIGGRPRLVAFIQP